MGIIQAVVLGLVQGATEFIPISSSGHLVLVPWLLSWPSPGLAFDTVLHLGTLLAVLAVFWPDLVALVSAWWRSIAQRNLDAPQARVAWWILLGTIPAALMGMLWEEKFEALFHSAVDRFRPGMRHCSWHLPFWGYHRSWPVAGIAARRSDPLLIPARYAHHSRSRAATGQKAA